MQVDVEKAGSTYHIIPSDSVGTGTNKEWISYFQQKYRRPSLFVMTFLAFLCYIHQIHLHNIKHRKSFEFAHS